MNASVMTMTYLFEFESGVRTADVVWVDAVPACAVPGLHLWSDSRHTLRLQPDLRFCFSVTILGSSGTGREHVQQFWVGVPRATPGVAENCPHEI